MPAGRSLARRLSPALALLLLLSSGRAADDPVATALAEAEAAAKAGHMDEALRLVEAAPATPLLDQRVRLLSERGRYLRRLGRLAEAEPFLRAALEQATALGEPSLLGQSLFRLGMLHKDQGNTAEASRLFDKAEVELLKLGRPVKDLGSVRLARAVLKYDAGDMLESYDLYASTLDYAVQAGDRRAEAFALGGLADCLVTLGRGGLAIPLLEDAIAWEKTQGDDAGVLSDQAMLARAYAHDDQVEKALGLVRELAASQVVLGSTEINRLVAAIVEVEVALGDPARAVEVTSRWMRDPRIAEVEGVRHSIVVLHAEALLANRRPAEALRALDAMGVPKLKRLEELWYRLRGRALDALGRLPDAEKEYRRAVDLDESNWTELSPQLLRTFNEASFRRTTLERLISLALARGDATTAYAYVGQLKARALAIWLANLRRGGAAETARARAATARVELGALHSIMRKVRWKLPAEGRLVAPPDTAVLDLYVGPGGVELFWLRGQVLRHVHSPAGLAEWGRAIGKLQAAIASRSKEWGAASEAVGELLLRPFAAELKEAEAAGLTLAVIPHGLLHDIPYAAVRLDRRTLLDRLPVWEATSVVSMQEAVSRPAVTWTHDAPGLAVGAVIGAESPLLPGAAAELEFVARSARAERLSGADATQKALLEKLSGRRRLHIAAHGFPGREQVPGWLELAPDAKNRDDGRLDSIEIGSLDFPADLVFLSACDTAVGPLGQADEGWSIVDRAFLLAGARTVISTRWPVDDAASARLAEAFYRELPRTGPLGALTAAQRELRALPPTPVATASRGLRPLAGEGEVDWSHPFYWGAFKLMGDPR